MQPMRMLTLLFCLLGTLAHAAPERYRLDTGRSQVGFTYQFNAAPRTGMMPVKSADMRIDLDNIPASQVTVTLDARAARAGFVFATTAMKSPQVLDTARYPDIHFSSTRITGDLSGATVTGDLTIRGITRPVTLQAGLYRQRGTAEGDRRRLTILLIGAVSRAAFGATGYPGYVGDTIALRILARIER